MVQQVDDPIGFAPTSGRAAGPVVGGVSGSRGAAGAGLEGRESTLFRPVVSGSLGQQFGTCPRVDLRPTPALDWMVV